MIKSFHKHSLAELDPVLEEIIERNPQWFETLTKLIDRSKQVNHRIPEHTKETFENYFNRGWEPGSFGMSVLCNDLVGAVSRADHINKRHLSEIVEWLVENAPRGSWGCEEAVREWLKKGPDFEQYQKKRVVEILSN